MLELRAMADELVKIAVRLTQEEKRRQAAQFALLGGVSIPAISALANKFEVGRIVPPWTTGPKWLASQAAKGMVIGGVMPVIRHQIEREIQEDAKERLRRERISRTLKRVLPGGEPG